MLKLQRIRGTGEAPKEATDGLAGMGYQEAAQARQGQGLRGTWASLGQNEGF